MQTTEPAQHARGALMGLIAYLIWGFAGLYWAQTTPAASIDVLAHRGLWSLPAVAIMLLLAGNLRTALALLRQPRVVAIMTLASACISVNWGVFLWAVTHGQATEASMGYFLLPLVNVLIGIVMFRERIDRPAQVAVCLAALGMLIQIVQLDRLPWVTFALAGSFGVYGAIRKWVSVGAMQGLFLETLFLFPFAAAWFVLHDGAGLGQYGWSVDLFLIGSGFFTAIPLVLHVAASRMMPLTGLGLLSYVGPSAQLFVALYFFREPFRLPHMISFALVWAGLLIVIAHNLRVARTARRQVFSER
jgi:chloramphenicol-sensitive protein RarD